MSRASPPLPAGVSPGLGRRRSTGPSCVAPRDNVANYREIVESGLGNLLCLGCEVFGRWADDVVRIVPAMVAENACGLPPLDRRGATQALAAR